MRMESGSSYHPTPHYRLLALHCIAGRHEVNLSVRDGHCGWQVGRMCTSHLILSHLTPSHSCAQHTVNMYIFHCRGAYCVLSMQKNTFFAVVKPNNYSIVHPSKLSPLVTSSSFLRIPSPCLLPLTTHHHHHLTTRTNTACARTYHPSTLLVCPPKKKSFDATPDTCLVWKGCCGWDRRYGCCILKQRWVCA